MATATITNGYGYSSPLLVHMSDDCYCVSVLESPYPGVAAAADFVVMPQVGGRLRGPLCRLSFVDLLPVLRAAAFSAGAGSC